MSLAIFDRFETTVASAYTASGGTLVLTDAPPNSGVFPYWLVVEAEGANTEECFKVTAGTTSLTVTGAQFNTAASDHASSAVVKGHIWGKEAYDQLRADLVLRGTLASLPAAGNAGRMYLPTDSPYELYDTGAAWIYRLPGVGEIVPPSASGWSWDNQAGSSIVSAAGYEYLTALDQGASEYVLRHRAAPTPPYTIDIVLRHDISSADPGSTPTGNRFGYGVGWRESDTGKLVDFRMGRSATAWNVTSNAWTDSVTAGASLASEATGQVFALVVNNPAFMRIEDDNTDLKMYWSIDYRNWELFFTYGRTTQFASAGPDQVFFGAYVQEQDVRVALLGWTEG